jgi:hypothetical protein
VENRVCFYAGWNPAARAPPKRRHFVANIEAAETCPSQPCEASILQQQKTQDSKGFRLKPFGPVWAASPRFLNLKDLSVGGEPTVLNLKDLSVGGEPTVLNLKT